MSIGKNSKGETERALLTLPDESPQSGATPPIMWIKPWAEAEKRHQAHLARLAGVFETGAMTRGCTEASWRAAFKALKCLVETGDESEAHRIMQQDDES